MTQRTISVPSTSHVPEPERITLPGRGETSFVDIGPRDAPPVLLLHALACTGLLNWYPALPSLTQRYRVITLDQRWHGKGIRSPEFSLADCAEDAFALTDELGIERFAVAGYSMGSLIAQLMARKQPGRLTGLVLCAAASTLRYTARHRLALSGFSTTTARYRARSPQQQTGGQVNNSSTAHTDHQWLYEQFRSTQPVEIAGAIDEITTFDSTPWLREITVPTSVVVTGKDRAIAPAHQHALARSIPAANSFEIQAGHAACVFRPGRFVPGLAAACASVHARSTR